jgi:hypothetical protein
MGERRALKLPASDNGFGENARKPSLIGLGLLFLIMLPTGKNLLGGRASYFLNGPEDFFRGCG